jgi:hypothetical protein
LGYQEMIVIVDNYKTQNNKFIKDWLKQKMTKSNFYPHLILEQSKPLLNGF